MVICASTFWFVACGGGSSDPSTNEVTNDDQEPRSTTDIIITGIAAAGVPIIGDVYIKGANGTEISTQIESDGTFSLNVNQLTPPYILYVESGTDGNSLKIYSAVDTANRINITPITDLILRNALSNSAEKAYMNWDVSELDFSALEISSVNTRNSILPILLAAELTNSFNLMSGSFATNHMGFDAVLDSLLITYNENTATITNRITGSHYTDNLTVLNDETGLPSSDSLVSVIALADLESIGQFWQDFTSFIGTSRSDNEVIEWFPTHIATDYMDEGETYAFLLEDWLSDEDEEKETTLSVTVISLQHLDTSTTSYSKGYAVKVQFLENSESEIEDIEMVFDGDNWLVYGDQKWMETELLSHAFYSTWHGTEPFSTGLVVIVEDDYLTGYNNGIRSAIVTGPGLPVEGLVLMHDYPEDGMSLFGGGRFVNLVSDVTIESIPDGAEYSFVFCQEVPSLIDNDKTSCTELYRDTQENEKRPVLNVDLNAQSFVVPTKPIDHVESQVNFGGLVNLSWVIPPNGSMDDVALNWSTDGTSHYVEADISKTDTSTSIDTTDLPIPDGWSVIYFQSRDQYERAYHVAWALY
ncbi:MAG: hypothetical protein JKY67_13565 [Pseudomonadales bacterium]|nr:hypothetical protein [Pseudomonadales bacterium]